MKFTADVVHEAPRPHESDRFCTVPIEGDSAFEVAQRVADIAARRRFGDDGMSGFIVCTNAGEDEGTRVVEFRAVIGIFRLKEGMGVLDGVTINVRLNAV
jgi:hypothetical protein